MRWIIPILLLSASSVWSQSPCYTTLIANGKEALQQHAYQVAINKFISARFCYDCPPQNEIDSNIKITQLAWVEALNQSIDEQQRLVQNLKLSNEKNDSLRLIEVALNEVLQEKKDSLVLAIQISERQRVQAESDRYTVQAQEALQDTIPSEALYLSYQALANRPDTIYPETKRAFAQSASLVLADTLFHHPAGFYNCYSDPHSPNILIEGKDGVLSVVEMNTKKVNQRTIQGKHIYHTLFTKNQDLVIGTDQTSLEFYKQGSSDPMLLGTLRQNVSFLYHLPSGDFLAGSRQGGLHLFDHQGAKKKDISTQGRRVIEVVSFSRGNEWMGRCGDGTLLFWTPDGQLIREIQSERPYVSRLMVHPNKPLVMSIAVSGGIKSWGPDGVELNAYGDQRQACRAAALLKNQDQVLLAYGNQLHLWSLEGDHLKSYPAHQNQVLGLAVDPTEKLFLSFSDDGLVFILDAQKDQRILDTLHHPHQIKEASFHPHLDYILTTTMHGTSHLWDFQGNELVEINLQKADPMPSFFMPDGESFICSLGDRAVAQYPIPEYAYSFLKEQDYFKTKERELDIKYRVDKK